MGLDSANRIWKKDETAALITLYETERCLYDRRDKDYFDPQKRKKGYERIHQVILRMKPECAVSDIKNRIKYLRSQYASELMQRKMYIEAGLCTENTYKPVMWCFGLLHFLDDFISTRKTSKVASTEEEKNDEADIEVISDNSSSKSISPSKRKSRTRNGIKNCSDVEKSSDVEDIEKTKKKRKVESPSAPETIVEDVPDVLSAQNNFDREDIFGQYVATEIRALRDNPLLYLQTKQSILEILTSANLEFLNPE